ncbi:MAG: uroporphyrin-III methyltransferase [Lachnospiraceae bacterium]|nr:uroporphyrin-III methyltransferase [Lachnospiraceae bacterium]
MGIFDDSLMDDIDIVDNEGEDNELYMDSYDSAESETGLTEEQIDELEDAGLDPMELWGMDEDERAEAISEAGLNPADYRFEEE